MWVFWVIRLLGPMRGLGEILYKSASTGLLLTETGTYYSRALPLSIFPELLLITLCFYWIPLPNKTLDP